jgi:hypothetical protein
MDVKSRAEKSGSISTRQLDLALEHSEMMKKLDIDNYSLSKIPKPDALGNRNVQKAVVVIPGKDTSRLIQEKISPQNGDR